MLTTEQLAEALEIAPKTLVNWRSLGKGPPFVRLGVCIRYVWADVERWVKARQASAGAS